MSRNHAAFKNCVSFLVHKLQVSFSSTIRYLCHISALHTHMPYREITNAFSTGNVFNSKKKIFNKLENYLHGITMSSSNHVTWGVITQKIDGVIVMTRVSNMLCREIRYLSLMTCAQSANISPRRYKLHSPLSGQWWLQSSKSNGGFYRMHDLLHVFLFFGDINPTGQVTYWY